MQNSVQKAYLQNKVFTASADQLQLMLYEGAIRFAQVCRMGIQERDYERAQIAYERCDAIVVELHSGLRPQMEPELTERYAALYNFCQRRMDEGNLKHDTSLIDDAILILQHLRETWLMVMDSIAQGASEQPEPSDAEHVSFAIET